MKKTIYSLALAAALAAIPPARAAVEGGYEQDDAGPPLTTWWVSAGPASVRADRDYVAGMRPHHAGALSMSREYLADPRASSPVLRVLAQAIIRNQSFEVALLDEVARDLNQPPVVLDLGLFRIAMRPGATEGLGQRSRFVHSPIPSLLDGLADPGKPVTERDVQFAKSMTIHHQAAVGMARGYLANPDARNGFLDLLNIDIERDQVQEIALMRQVVAQYPGDAEAVRVDPSMIHGMEGMGHGGAGHGAHGGMAMPAAIAPNPAQPASPPPRAAPQPGSAMEGMQQGGHMHH